MAFCPNRRQTLASVCVLSALLLLCMFLPGGPSPEERFQQGLQALETGDEATVLAVLNELQDRPEFADHVRLLVGLSSRNAGRHQAALESFSRMDPDGPLRDWILLNAGISHHALGSHMEAERLFRLLVKENPDLADGHRWLGIVYYDLGAFDFAITHLKRLTELEPDDYRPYRLLGLMHRDFERDVEAASHYRKALERDPPETIRSEVIRELAWALISQREYRQALQLLDAESPDVESLAQNARCLLNLGEKTKSGERLQEAIRMDPDHRAVLMLQAELFQADNQSADALKSLRRLVKLDPFDTEAKYQLALVLRKLGKDDESQREMAEWEEQKKLNDRLTELNVKALGEPHNSELRFKIADLCEKLGKTKLAAMWRQAGEAIRAASPTN